MPSPGAPRELFNNVARAVVLETVYLEKRNPDFDRKMHEVLSPAPVDRRLLSRRKQPSASFWTIIDRTSRRKPWLTWLASRPGRFEYVHTPRHGSWLNLIECAFSKMAHTFLRFMRVASIAELKARILKGIDEINAAPVVFRWKKFDLGLA